MDRWYWRAIYNDGTGVSQLETNPSTGMEWSSDHVDMSRLIALVLEPLTPQQNRVILHVQPGELARRFWRHYVTAGGQDIGLKRTCWVLSLEKNGITFYNFFKPDGTIVLSTNFEYGSEVGGPN